MIRAVKGISLADSVHPERPLGVSKLDGARLGGEAWPGRGIDPADERGQAC